MIRNYRPVPALGIAIVLLSSHADAYHRDHISKFAFVGRRSLNSTPTSSMAAPPLVVSAATIDAAEVFSSGSFFAGECDTTDDDCRLFDGGNVIASSSMGVSIVTDDGNPPPVESAATSAATSSLAARSSATMTRISNNNVALLTVIVALTVRLVLVLKLSLLWRLSTFISWYVTRLEVYPLITKCVTGGIIALIGDYGAQRFEHSLESSSSRQWKKRIHTDESEGPEPASSFSHHSDVICANDDVTQQIPLSLPQHDSTYDARRGMARFLECLLISSPLMHLGYDYFERILPVVGGTSMYRSFAALSHVVADSLFLDGIFVGTGILATGVLEGKSFRQYVIPNLRNVYLPTWRASVVTSTVLMPLQFLSFRFLPVQLRVLSVNAVDLVWTAVVSFVSHSGDRE